MDIHAIYAQELLHYRFGTALWLPEPSPEWGPIRLADVGYIQDGKFNRLFNVSLPADDPSHKRLGVPDGFESLDSLELWSDARFLDAGSLHSTSVQYASAGASLSG